MGRKDEQSRNQSDQGQVRQGQQQPPPRQSTQRQVPPNTFPQKSLTDKLRDEIPLKRTLFFGIFVFILGMGTVFGLFVLENTINNDFGDELADLGDGNSDNEGGDIDDVISVFGIFYFNTHFADTVASDEAQTESADFLDITFSEVSNTIPLFVYRLVPVSFLILGGYLIANGVDNRDASLSPWIFGSSIIIGYLPMVLFGTQQFSITEVNGGLFTLEPAFGQTVLFAGLIYPIIFGGFGGYLSE